MATKLSIRRAQVHVPNTCAWCESIQEVNWYCNDCQEALCDRCFDGHQRARKTRNDVVVPIRKATRQGGAVLPEVCTTHPGKSCDLFCTECHVVVCSVCFTQKHKQHTFKHLEEEIDSQKRYMHDQLKNLKSSLKVHYSTLTKRHADSKSFKENADVIRQTVQTQRLKLKAKIDSIADSVLVELSSLVEEEDKSHIQDCQSHETNIKEINQLIRDVEQTTEKISSTSLFELTGRLRTTIPKYDVTTKTVLPRLPSFMPGTLNADQMKSMIGYIHVRVRQIATFQVPQKKQINSICPIDDTQAWISVHASQELIKVNKKGKVTESVKLDFVPWCLTVINTEELLITCSVGSPLIHKLSKDRRVTRFTDISPLQAWGISECDEVFVTTRTKTIQVLNMSGDRIRQISCANDGLSVVCLTTGSIVVAIGFECFRCVEMIVVNKPDQIIRNWSGKLGRLQKLGETMQCDIARDRYDRVFVPDMHTNQVYVLSGNEIETRCLLDEKLGVTDPVAVCVDRCGHVWIGCRDGTVHVMQL